MTGRIETREQVRAELRGRCAATARYSRMCSVIADRDAIDGIRP
jgi:hypothetical protein